MRTSCFYSLKKESYLCFIKCLRGLSLESVSSVLIPTSLALKEANIYLKKQKFKIANTLQVTAIFGIEEKKDPLRALSEYEYMKHIFELWVKNL